jgi:hypothetical protein
MFLCQPLFPCTFSFPECRHLIPSPSLSLFIYSSCFIFVLTSVLSARSPCSLWLSVFSVLPIRVSNYALCLCLADANALSLCLRNLHFLSYLSCTDLGVIDGILNINFVSSSSAEMDDGTDKKADWAGQVLYAGVIPDEGAKRRG